MPSPHLPSMITIFHLIEPVIDLFLKYGDRISQLIPTVWHPDGIWVHVKITPLIADLEGDCKVSSFLTTSTTYFCSFCLCTSAQIEDVDLSAWRPCEGAEVCAQADRWLNMPTKSGQEVLAMQYGVWWTLLLHLLYWDPVKHVMLSFMHNWLEGILENHTLGNWCTRQCLEGHWRDRAGWEVFQIRCIWFC